MRIFAIAPIFLFGVLAGGASASWAAGGAFVQTIPTTLSRVPPPTLTESQIRAAKPTPGYTRKAKRYLRKQRRPGRAVAGPSAYGSDYLPFTQARVNPTFLPAGYARPYNRVGKVFALKNDKWYGCSGSLIRPGIVVTAAHCLSKYGKSYTGMAKDVHFIPAFNGGLSNFAPFGIWKAVGYAVPDVHALGIDTCTSTAVCNNDVAIVALQQIDGENIGDKLGYFKYGVNAANFMKNNALGTQTALVTVLGFPGAYDDGNVMQRGDSIATLNAWNGTYNFSYGSAMGPGVSGGPLVVNFGTPADVTSPGYGLGSAGGEYVIGVAQSGPPNPNNMSARGTYFGINGEYPKAIYGSYVGGNIGYLLNKICTDPKFAASC